MYSGTCLTSVALNKINQSINQSGDGLIIMGTPTTSKLAIIPLGQNTTMIGPDMSNHPQAPMYTPQGASTSLVPSHCSSDYLCCCGVLMARSLKALKPLNLESS